MSAETTIRIAAFLDSHHVMSLATAGSAGPHAANVFYARDALVLVWMSEPSSRHSLELAADGRVAATVAPDYTDFADIRGVQIAGHAHIITDAPGNAKARALLEARYLFLRRLSQGPATLQEAYGRIRFYRLEPERMMLIDNSRGFGHKDTIEYNHARSATTDHAIERTVSPPWS
jgi:uncharacterized protein